MSEEKVPRFLQQTTSQLLHQQEALRKRREMLEKASVKPPVMRFGTGSPPRSHTRQERSPVPPSSNSSYHHSRQNSHSTSYAGEAVHRELNWSRTEEESTTELAPMRFSMAARPGNAPPQSTGLHRSQTTCSPRSISSPTPREVNTSDHVDGIHRKDNNAPSTPSRTPSPKSPAIQRLRGEFHSVSDHRRGESPLQQMVNDEPVQLSETGMRHVEANGEAVEPNEGRRSTATPSQPPISSTQGEVGEGIVQSDDNRSHMSVTEVSEETGGIAGFSNTFPVPHFSVTTPRGAKSREAADGSEDTIIDEQEKEEDTTPGRPAVGVFRTPRPVTRLTATSLSPVPVPTNTPVTVARQNKAEISSTAEPPSPQKATEDEETQTPEGQVHHVGSPSSTARQILDSMDVSTEKRCCARPAPHPCVHDRSPEKYTPSPSQHLRGSPAPTAADLIHSVQVSAERRPCGCERPTVSSSRSPRRATPPSPTTSPAPTPVEGSDMPMTEYGSTKQRCCDRPTPQSISSQPAGGEARVAAATSASPGLTTEGIIHSIRTGAQEEQRRARETSQEGCPSAEEEEERFSNEDYVSRMRRRASATVLNFPYTPGPSAEDDEEGGRAAMHTPSPVPTERQYGESLLASAEKRRGGRPTPVTREGSGAELAIEAVRETTASSTSPQPNAHHLLESLDVSIEKGQRTREGPVQRETKEEKKDEAESHRTALRTPSPTPTPEHVLASLHASAEKRTRCAAMAVSRETETYARKADSSDASPRSNSFHSPALTPQNVKDSIQKLVDDKRQHLSRGDAQAPKRPWEEDGRTSALDFALNDSASPVVSADDVDMSLRTLEREQQWQSRSGPVERPTASFSHSPSPPSPPRETAPSSSPVGSDFVTQSAMFFDCLSAPPTPALPTVLSAAAATKASSVTSVAQSPVPLQLAQLQREVAAISEGRGRSRTPPLPLRTSEHVSPVPTSDAAAPAEPEEVTRSEVSVELPTCDDVAAVTEETQTVADRRSSLLLVYPTDRQECVLQHPHEPQPSRPPPSVSPVRIPRTPTPPPRLPVTSQPAESPLPRPVTLRSQVSLPQHHSRSPVPGFAAVAHRYGVSLQTEEAITTAEVSSMERAHGHTVILTESQRRKEVAVEEEADLFDSKNDWMDLVEPLRPQTITVSPHTGSVIRTVHSSGRTEAQDPLQPAHDAEGVPSHSHPFISPSLTRKRSRSIGTQAPGEETATPASVVLSVHDGTPVSERVAVTPRSSPRGRRSQAEALMAMLPADVMAEVTRIELAETEEKEGRRNSVGSPDSPTTASTEEDAGIALGSTISQRVSQRAPRLYRNYDDYILYLEGVTTSSAKKSRADAGRRTQKAFKKHLQKGRTHQQEEEKEEEEDESSVSPTRGGRRVSPSTETPVSARRSSPSSLSPMTSSPAKGARTDLTVSTRLSAELQDALFEESSAKSRNRHEDAQPPTRISNKTEAETTSKPKKKTKASKKAAKKAKAARAKALLTHEHTGKAARKFVTSKSLRSMKSKGKHGNKL